MNRMLNHDFYDSMIFSGKINFLSPNIQQSTQDTFQKIKDHNRYLRKTKDIENDAMECEDISNKTIPYYEILEEIEEELLSDIPSTRENLKSSLR